MNSRRSRARGRVERMASTSFLRIAAVLVLACAASADTWVLKDGRRIEGTLVSESGGVITVKTSFGDILFKTAEVDRVERGKTRAEEFAGRWKAAKTAEEFFQLGRWAEEKKLTADTKRCMLRAVELDAKHAGANAWLGKVEYKGDWMTPAERDARQAADLEAEMLAKGLVRWRDQWVTPDEKGHLERNEVLLDGKWIPFEDAQRKQGLELSAGAWLPRAEALARNDALVAGGAAKIPLAVSLGSDALVAGPYPVDFLDGIGKGLVKGRAWFDGVYAPPKGLELFHGRMAELYVFGENEPYVATIATMNAWTKTLPAGWAEAVAKTHGFFFSDPFPVSSARRWGRAEADLAGHCYHHWGHLLVASLGYDGRVLPPWYEEGIAALTEFRSHGRNAVFCRGRASFEEPVGPSTGGPGPKKDPGTKVKPGANTKPKPTDASPDFDPRDLRGGAWAGALKNALASNGVPSFDTLCTRQFTELESADIAAAMGIVQWLESRNALRAFHDEMRKHAPSSPLRIHDNPYDRMACYEKAFQAAVKLSTKDADAAWRAWFTSR